MNSLCYVSATSGLYSPLLQDTPYPGGDWAGAGGAGVGTSAGCVCRAGRPGPPSSSVQAAAGNAPDHDRDQLVTTRITSINGPGLPFAYDPLWWYEAQRSGIESQRV